MVKILFIGASQGIGRAVSQLGLRRGHMIRGMSRTGSLPDDANDNAEAFKGDALRAADLSRALDGVDVVVQALGVPPSLDLLLKPVTLFSEATRVLLPEMKAAGVKQLVSVTGFGAGDSNASINMLQRLPFDMLLKRAYDDKTVQEQLIEESDPDWLIVRPGVLTNGPATGEYRVLSEPAEWRNSIISRADVADFIVGSIEAGDPKRKKPVIIRYPL